MKSVQLILTILTLAMTLSTNYLRCEDKETIKEEKLIKSTLGLFYYKYMFGHLHQNPNKYSSALTTISCGHPVKVLKIKNKKGDDLTLTNDSWYSVVIGPYEGFLPKDVLSDKKVECFQDRYMKFFDSFNLELNEIYYWGKLYDQYVDGRSRVK